MWAYDMNNVFLRISHFFQIVSSITLHTLIVKGYKFSSQNRNGMIPGCWKLVSLNHQKPPTSHWYIQNSWTIYYLITASNSIVRSNLYETRIAFNMICLLFHGHLIYFIFIRSRLPRFNIQIHFGWRYIVCVHTSIRYENPAYYLTIWFLARKYFFSFCGDFQQLTCTSR